MKVPSSLPNFTQIGATCHPCGAKPQNRSAMSKLNSGVLRFAQYAAVKNSKTLKGDIP